MINLFKNGAYLVHGNEIIPEEELSRAEATLGRKTLPGNQNGSSAGGPPGPVSLS